MYDAYDKCKESRGFYAFTTSSYLKQKAEIHMNNMNKIYKDL